jgi:ribulose-5-phosphate 4-epimerase/fuculose-1-phosphate aldolase
MTANEASLRDLLVRTARRMLADGLVTGTSGNLSTRVPGSERILLTPSGVDYEAMEPQDIVVVDADGRPFERSAAAAIVPTSDTPIHVAIYGARPDVEAIVHTHSPYAVAFSTIPEEIPALTLEGGGYLGGPVRVAAYEQPGGADAPRRLAASLGGDRAILLPHHGVVTVGESLGKAYHAAVAVEEGARVAWLARAIGRPKYVPADDIAWMHEFIHRRYGQR